MHEHIYSLFVTVERTVPELGIPKAWFECACGETLESYEGLARINAAQPRLICPVCEQSAGTYTACSYCHSEVMPSL